MGYGYVGGDRLKKMSKENIYIKREMELVYLVCGDRGDKDLGGGRKKRRQKAPRVLQAKCGDSFSSPGEGPERALVQWTKPNCTKKSLETGSDKSSTYQTSKRVRGTGGNSRSDSSGQGACVQPSKTSEEKGLGLAITAQKRWDTIGKL